MDAHLVKDLRETIEGLPDDTVILFGYRSVAIYKPVPGPIEVYHRPWGKQKDRIARLERGVVAIYYEADSTTVEMREAEVVTALYQSDTHALVSWDVNSGYTSFRLKEGVW